MAGRADTLSLTGRAVRWCGGLSDLGLSIALLGAAGVVAAVLYLLNQSLLA